MVGKGLGAGTLEGLLLSSCKELNFCAVCLAAFPIISPGKLLIIIAPKSSALILKHSLRKIHPYTDEETEAG